jgi:GcrA cell cycle regulator
MGNAWTPEQDDQLRRDWANGLTCSQIAGRLGRPGATRNSVIGRVSRLKLPARNHRSTCSHTYHVTGSKRKVTTKPKRKPQPKEAKPYFFGAAAKVAPAIRRDGLPIPPPEATDVPRVSFADLEAHHCRWICKDDPTGHPQHEPLFCGEKKLRGLPYCEPHALRAGMRVQVALARLEADLEPFVPRVVERKSEAA